MANTAILERGHSIEWRDAEHRWIESFRASGAQLRNKTEGRNGVELLGREARAKLSKALKGVPKSPEHSEKIAAAQRGMKRNWSKDGEVVVRKTQFHPGHRTWEKISPEARESHNKAAREQWDAIPKETRSARAHERSMKEWANRNADERKEIGRRISAGKKAGKPPEERSRIASEAAKALWANMTPEVRGDYLRQRNEAVRAGIRAYHAARRAKAVPRS